MYDEKIDLFPYTTVDAPLCGLSISTRSISDSFGQAEVCVGYLGRHNSSMKMQVGDFILFEKSEGESIEVRLLGVGTRNRARFRIRPLPLGVFAHSEPLVLLRPLGEPGPDTTEPNSPLTPPEVQRIQVAVTKLKEAVRFFDAAPDRLRDIDEQLDRMEAAASKLGRKDWITLAVGTLTNVVVAAALGPEPARGLFALAGRLITWCLSAAPSLLP